MRELGRREVPTSMCISRKRVSGKEASNSYAMLEFVVSSS